jgi:hypothetical protein
MAAVQLSNVAGTLLPPTITEPIFLKAAEESAVMKLARRIPLSVSATTAIPVPMDIPTAGWVSEGGSKPVAQGGVGVKTMTGKKVALLVPVSQEVAMTNAAGLYAQLEQDLPTAIGRAFDYAAIHGLDLKSGAAGPFQDYLKQTPNQQAIGAATPAQGGVYTDLWNGVSKVLQVPGMQFSGFAADPLLRPEAAMSVDVNGRPFFVNDAYDANQGNNTGSLIGYPVAFNSGVSGRYYRSGDTVQTAALVGTPTGGTFTVTIGGATTAPLAYTADGPTVQTAVRALPGATTSTISVTGAASGPYTFTFTGPASPVSVNQKGLTGGTAATSQSTIAQSPVIDQGLRAIGGDFSQCAYGVGMEISMKVSSEANYFDGVAWHSAFQENLILLLVEAYYGFVVGTPNAFVAYTHATGS